jgi:hypothetical protein
MKADSGELVGAIAFFAAAAVFWWIRRDGMRKGRISSRFSGSHSRDENPAMFQAICGFYAVGSVCFAAIGLFALGQYLGLISG